MIFDKDEDFEADAEATAICKSIQRGPYGTDPWSKRKIKQLGLESSQEPLLNFSWSAPRFLTTHLLSYRYDLQCV